MSKTDQDFLGKIAEVPGDDTARLVYADWLDEQGRLRDKAKAEFIRTQVELSRIADETSPRYMELKQREEQLLLSGDNWENWVRDGFGHAATPGFFHTLAFHGPVPSSPGFSGVRYTQPEDDGLLKLPVVFRRGLPDEITLPLNGYHHDDQRMIQQMLLRMPREMPFSLKFAYPTQFNAGRALDRSGDMRIPTVYASELEAIPKRVRPWIHKLEAAFGRNPFGAPQEQHSIHWLCDHAADLPNLHVISMMGVSAAGVTPIAQVALLAHAFPHAYINLASPSNAPDIADARIAANDHNAGLSQELKDQARWLLRHDATPALRDHAVGVAQAVDLPEADELTPEELAAEEALEQDDAEPLAPELEDQSLPAQPGLVVKDPTPHAHEQNERGPESDADRSR